VVRPEIIFADEPTGNLDSNTSREIMNLMQRVVRERNQTLIMVTHDNTLASFADRIIRIMDGKIVDMVYNNSDGKTEEENGNDKA
jgi:putative ABC transport system ATP-binding protein